VSSADSSRELASLLKTLRAEYAAAIPSACGAPGSAAPGAMSGMACGACSFDPGEPLLGCFVKSFLLWESTTPKAMQAMKRMEAALVDLNELRTCMPDEILRLLGERYPRGAERALRLRTALNVIYAREHRVTLEPLAGLPPQEARERLDRIEGVPAFVSARVCLVGLAHHAAPVDSRIHRRLVEARVAPADSTCEGAAAILEKKTRAGELPETYGLLQAWADDAAYPAAESHLSDLRPIHKPVAEHIKREQEASRKAARKAKRSAGALRKKKTGRSPKRRG
jgi:hypothetical protein